MPTQKGKSPAEGGEGRHLGCAGRLKGESGGITGGEQGKEKCVHPVRMDGCIT